MSIDCSLSMIGLSELDVFTYRQFNSAVVVLYSTMTIIMLQRTKSLGDLITMFSHILSEFKKFVITFGLIFVCFVIVGHIVNTEIKLELSSMW